MRRWARLAAAALGVGLAVGVGVWLFKRAIDLAELASHGWFADTWAEAGIPWVLLVPAAGGLLVGLLLHHAGIPEEPGHGVAEVIEAVALGDRDMPVRHVPVKAGIAALSLGSGASLGPEDPAVEIGGGLGMWLTGRFRLGAEHQQTLVAAGAAAGLSAAFHAPLAAVLLAVEVFTVRLRSRTTVIVAIAAGGAFAITRVLEPVAEPVVPAYALSGGREIVAAGVLGVAAGLVAAGQIKLLYRLEHAVVRWKAPPRWAKPAMGGAVLGLAGLAAPELLGIGYGTVEPIIAGSIPALAVLLGLALGKVLLTAVSFGSGFLGGFFAPCLFIGATLGAAFGVGASALAGDLRPEVLALAGMAAVLAGCVRAPLTSVLLLTALSGSYALTPVLLAAALPAHHVSRALERHSLYTYGVEEPADGPPPDHPGGHPQRDAQGGTESAED